MKLRNKKTGEIVEPFGITCMNGRTFVRFDDGKGTFKFEVHSLAELNEWWEDYEEPEMFYLINYDGKICKAEIGTMDRTKIKEIGNYFDTRKEAEKAVEKLTAVKRLKDKGLYVTTFYVEDGSLVIRAKTHNSSGAENWDDLHLLFGGEE